MSLSELLRKFDNGVSMAWEEFESRAPKSAELEFRDTFAAFAFYSAHKEGARFRRLDLKEGPEPILWEKTHDALAQLLKKDPDIGPYYAGFATLFTINHDALSSTGSVPRWSSMSIGVPLGSPGFLDLRLSRKQFVSTDPYRPIPLTAVCLNNIGNLDFKTTPIIFHWQRAASDVQDSIADDLYSWGHIFVSADIPYDTVSEENGINLNVQGCGFVDPIRVIDNRNGFNDTEFYKRLGLYAEDKGASKLDLAMRLTWTTTYFAYAVECLGSAIQPHSVQPLQNMAIVCAPASFESVVSTALYVPLIYPSTGMLGQEFERAALKILYLARTLATPLERFYELSIERQRGASAVIDVFAHETKPLVDLVQSWPCPIDELFDVSAGANDKVVLAPKLGLEGLIDWTRCRLVTFSDYFDSILSELRLWTMANSISDLPFYRTDTDGNSVMPENLYGLAEACFSVAKKHILFKFILDCKGFNDHRESVLLLEKYLESKFPQLIVDRLASGLGVLWKSDPTSAVFLSRLLIVIFREAIEHGRWQDPISCVCYLDEWTSSVSVIISNYRYNQRFPELFEDCPATDRFSPIQLQRIRNNLDTKTHIRSLGRQGKKVIAFLAMKAKGRLLKAEALQDGKYAVDISFEKTSFSERA